VNQSEATSENYSSNVAGQSTVWW